MMRWAMLAGLSILVTSCVFPLEHPDVPTVPDIADVVAPGETPAITPPPPPVAPDLPPVTYVMLPPPPPAAPAKKAAKPVPEPSPQQLILEAQREARIAPTKQGYFGKSGVQRYLWQPGKIYDIYLAPGVGTKLELPLGEVLAHDVILNPKSFDVSTATVGTELTARSLLLLRPCAAVEPDCVAVREVDVALTSTSGRSYNLHLIIGQVGMIGVTWELTHVPHLALEEPGMLPRRTP